MWAKVEGFGEGRAVRTVEPKPEGFGPNSPGPSGFRAADARFVEPVGRWNRIGLRVSPAGSFRRPRNRIDSI
jgi:hypothetical protein